MPNALHRRPWAVTGALLLAGCSGGTTPAAGASGAAPAGPAVSVGPVPAAGTQAICARAAAAGTAFGQVYLLDLKHQIDAAGQGTQARERADRRIAQDVRDYSRALAEMAELASDAALKQALTDISKQVTALDGDLTKIDPGAVPTLGATLDGVCGEG